LQIVMKVLPRRNNDFEFLVVEDSPVVRGIPRSCSPTRPEIMVIGTATNGEKKRWSLRHSISPTPKSPWTSTCQRWHGTGSYAPDHGDRSPPIVIVSASVDVKETTAAFQALEAGAAGSRRHGLWYRSSAA